MQNSAFAGARLKLPEAPALAVGLNRVVWVAADGSVERLDRGAAARRLGAGAVPFVCHARAAAARLGVPLFPAYDLLSLFAFVRPARFCVPSPTGLAEALLLERPSTLAEEAALLRRAAMALLSELVASPGEVAAGIARAMAAGGWPWAPLVLAAVAGGGRDADRPAAAAEALRVWTRIRDWEDAPPPPPPAAWPVEPVEARARLVRLLGDAAETRARQLDYASAAAAAFRPRDRAGDPAIALIEAGTGIGKTLGYIAPATLWAEKNKGAVWISTHTRNLQRQLDRELDRAFPDRRVKAARVVVRKGRENLLCLLNYETAVARTQVNPDDGVALGLVARWLLATRDGDMVGGDFPGWLAELLGSTLTLDLTDERGECIYAACRHFRRCFIERTVRRARHADIVVANHALVLAQAARADEALPPTRFVFDEGHHLFGAADAAFALHLTGRELAELRTWITGGEGRRSRRRGLAERLGDLVGDDAEAEAALLAATQLARGLPGRGWRQRLAAAAAEGPAEAFLALVRQQVDARSRAIDGPYSREAAVAPPVPGLLTAGEALADALGQLRRPLGRLARALARRLDAEADSLDSATRQRLDGLRRGIERRALDPLAGWRAMLKAIGEGTPPAFVDWLEVARWRGQDIDVGVHRHWVDPMLPFARTVLEPAHGVLITSATLCDGDSGNGSGTGSGDGGGDGGGGGWAIARAETGVRHLAVAPQVLSLPSPFDYRRQTRVLVTADVDRDDPRQVAAALKALFVAAGGGALGLFTAVSRLAQVWRLLAPALEDAGLKLLAQHMDALDTGTLVDIFRAEENACLLGTDALREGIDVPGRALRLVVLDRVPWPRPTLLHRARREAFGGRAHDDRLTRLRLTQAYGRLIRQADDKGVFVLLDRGLPSRLASAFPPEVTVARVGLADAVAIVAATVRPHP